MVITAFGVTAIYLNQRQKGEKGKMPSSATIQSMRDRVLSIIKTWDGSRMNHDPILDQISSLKPKRLLVPALLSLLKHEDVTVRLFAIRGLETVLYIPPPDARDYPERRKKIEEFIKYLSPDLLAIGLEDENSTVRIRTATMVLRKIEGESRLKNHALKILQEGASVDETMAFSEPPIPISQFAKWMLREYGKRERIDR